jgi:hypothetical protein
MSERFAQGRLPSLPASPTSCANTTTGALGTHDRRRAMSMPEIGWTSELVAKRLAEAADVLARLPEERLRGVYDLWPRIKQVPPPAGCRAGGDRPYGRGARMVVLARAR